MKKKMTRAEEAALEAYPRDDDRDLNFRRKNYRIAYERGYVQAEKDIIPLIDSLQQEQPNSEDLLEWAKKKFNEVEIAMETGADDPALWGERKAFKQVIDKLNSM